MNGSPLSIVAAIVVALCASVPSLAAQRTFVASTGSDANPCTLAAPCRGFGAALTATPPGGEVVVLDSAGYGPASVSRSVSIVAPTGVYAGVSVSVGQGLAINAPGGVVVLRGLTITGLGGADGIVVESAARVTIDRCIVAGFSNAGIRVGGPGVVAIVDSETRGNTMAGVEITGADATIERLHATGSLAGIAVSGNSSTTIHRSIVSDNNVGIWIKLVSPAPAAYAHVAISETVVDRNSGNGILAESGVSGNLLEVAAVRNTVTRSGYAIYVHAMGGGVATLTATDNDVNQNAIQGLGAGPYATLIASRNTVTRNLVGLFADFVGHLRTRGDNTVDGNGTDVSGVLEPIGGK